MARTFRARKTNSDVIWLPKARAELLGFLKLLAVARVSAEAHCAEGDCVALLDECIASLVARNGVSHSELQTGVTAQEFMQIPTLLRALTYACEEALENLDEPDSAALLAKCITSLRASSSEDDIAHSHAGRLYN